MKKVLRRIGLWLLRRSGWDDIPDEVLKRVYTPRVLATSFAYPTTLPLGEVEGLWESKIEQLCLAAKPHVVTQEVKKDDFTQVKFTLLVQKPDPPL